MNRCLELSTCRDKAKYRPTKIFLFFALFLALSGTGCQKSRVARASRDLAANIANTRTPTGVQVDEAIPIIERRVYIDSSLSMKGFVNAENHTTFDELLDEIGNALPGCRLYKYGQASNTAPPNVSELYTQIGFGREIHTPAFYSLAYNPDDRLIDSLTKDARPVLSVLVTDGVYSEPEGSTSPPVVDAIVRWMQSGRVFGIFAFTSSFNGPFYSERHRAMLPSFSIPARPFYAFVFSPTERAFTDLEEKLRPRFQNIRSILFSKNVASITVTVPTGTRALYSFKSPPSSPFYWRMYDADLFSQTNSALINYNINYSISSAYPANQFKTDLNIDYYRWEQNKFRKIDTGPPAGFKYDRPAGAAIENSAASGFAVTLPRDTSSDYGFYDFKISASIGSLRPDLLNLSTRDDGVRENAGKTYRFFEFISAVTDVHFKTQLAAKVSPAVFVTVANH